MVRIPAVAILNKVLTVGASKGAMIAAEHELSAAVKSVYHWLGFLEFFCRLVVK
jgi:hypothetical protein